MKASLLYRIASVLLLLFALSHTLGFQQTDSKWGVDLLLGSMRSIHFDVLGFNRSFWDFFLAAGYSRARALGAGAALGVATVIGGFFAGYFAPLRSYGLPLAAGVALYVGASNLVPEFQGTKGWGLPVSFFAGCGLYLLARNLMGGLG